MSTPKKSYLGVLLGWAVVMALLLGLCMAAAAADWAGQSVALVQQLQHLQQLKARHGA
ncbi:MAG: hypothetical protein ORN29_02330 [Rhodoferax sp.]|nr:hypothetical protein [Rhodoferax sp.]